MSETQVKIGNALLKSLVEMKEEKGELNMEDVGALFESMATSLPGEGTLDAFLRNEIQKLSEFLSKALSEISSMTPEEDEDEENPSPQNISRANSELEEVVKATEEATNTILDAADLIQEKVGSISGADEATGVIMDSTIKIYDACNFQDITGQRISKVVRTLDYLDVKIKNLKQLIDERIAPTGDVDEEFKDKRADAHLMSGPQSSGEAPSQDDIDKLFASS